MNKHLQDITARAIDASWTNRLKAAVRRHEAHEQHLDRLDRLDYDGMTLQDLQREHLTVTHRITLGIHYPEGLQGLEERQQALTLAIEEKTHE